MPELSWRYGYPAVLCLMVAASSGLYIGFKRSGWLLGPARFGPPAALDRLGGRPPDGPARATPAYSWGAACQESSVHVHVASGRSLVVAAGICVLAGAGPGGRASGQQPERRRGDVPRPTPASS